MIENNIKYSEDFIYPSDGEELDGCEKRSSHDIIVALSSFLIASDKPKLTLAAILYASGMDVGIVLGCDNNVTHIAEKFGISKQGFQQHVELIRDKLGICHCDTGKSQDSRDLYRKNNRRIIK